MSSDQTIFQDDRESLGSKLKKGIAWKYIQTMFGMVFRFGTGIVLARLLAPSDFGLFASVTAITSLLMLQVNFGWASAILRARKIDNRLLSSIFWCMQSVAVLLMIIITASAFWLGRFYNDERFAMVMILVCLQFFIMPFNNINGSLLRWKMRYDLISRISMVVTVISSVIGICLAYIGYGVYSLVATGIFSSILLTGIMAWYAPWRPSFTFSADVIRPHFDFTWRLHLNNSLNLLSDRIDNMMIGKLTNMRELGIYVKAFSLGRMPVSLLGSNLYQMFFTALSQVRDNRSDSIVLFQKMLACLTWAIYLPLVILFLAGEGFVFHLYGEKWLGAVLPMQIMIFGSFPKVISMTCGAFCDSQNLVKKETKVQCMNVILTIAAVFIGSRWGLEGLAAGIAVKAYLMLLMMKAILSRGIDLTWWHLWKPVWPSLCAAFAGVGAALIIIWGFGPSYSSTNLVHMLSVTCAATLGYAFVWLFLAFKLKGHPELQTLLESGINIAKRLSDKRSS